MRVPLAHPVSSMLLRFMVSGTILFNVTVLNLATRPQKTIVCQGLSKASFGTCEWCDHSLFDNSLKAVYLQVQAVLGRAYVP